VRVVETRNLASRTEGGLSRSRYQVEASRAVVTLPQSDTSPAAVSLIDKPNLDAHHIRSAQSAADELLQQVIHRLLVGDIQEQLRGIIGVKPTIA
jgi:hypothetical protein